MSVPAQFLLADRSFGIFRVKNGRSKAAEASGRMPGHEHQRHHCDFGTGKPCVPLPIDGRQTMRMLWLCGSRFPSAQKGGMNSGPTKAADFQRLCVCCLCKASALLHAAHNNFERNQGLSEQLKVLLNPTKMAAFRDANAQNPTKDSSVLRLI